jgi:hypothetical protein
MIDQPAQPMRIRLDVAALTMVDGDRGSGPPSIAPFP